MSFLRHATFTLLGLSLAPAIFSFSPGFPYGSQKVRGVNLGGWLVLEPWITPSLFDDTGNSNIVDEWTFGQLQDRKVAQTALKKHWDTWFTEDDFINIAAAGLNHVRLPIGYWAFEVGPGEPYIQGQLPYLEKAVTWADNHGLKLIVDLHGAPGSQNGFDNSGQRLSFPRWHSNQTDIKRTNAIMKTMATMFTGNPNVVPIIAPLNEPAGFDGQAVLTATRQYWKDSYQSIRYPNGSLPSNTVELIHDAFQPASYWKGFEVAPGYQGVAMDTHIYQVFSDSEVAMTYQDHIKTACKAQSTLSNYDLWVIVGEWTTAPTDCARYLNGRGVGSRYDGSYPKSNKVGSCKGMTGQASTFSPAYKDFLRRFWEAQVISYERGGDGWIHWTWKAENADDWTYQAGLVNHWIPQNPTSFKYPSICDQDALQLLSIPST